MCHNLAFLDVTLRNPHPRLFISLRAFWCVRGTRRRVQWAKRAKVNTAQPSGEIWSGSDGPSMKGVRNFVGACRQLRKKQETKHQLGRANKRGKERGDGTRQQEHHCQTCLSFSLSCGSAPARAAFGPHAARAFA